MNYLDIIRILREDTDKKAARESWINTCIKYKDEQKFSLCKTSKVNDSIMHSVMDYIPSHSDVTHNDWKIIP